MPRAAHPPARGIKKETSAMIADEETITPEMVAGLQRGDWFVLVRRTPGSYSRWRARIYQMPVTGKPPRATDRKASLGARTRLGARWWANRWIRGHRLANSGQIYRINAGSR